METNDRMRSVPGNGRMVLEALARQGGPDPVAAVVIQHSDMVYATCCRVLGNDAEAADVAQETFFHFLKNFGKIRGSMGGWLHQVATHRSIDLVRQNVSRRRREEAYVAEAPSEPGTWLEVQPLVDEALEALPAEEREILVEYYLEQRSMGLIGQQHGWSQSTVSRRIAAALEALRGTLRGKGVLVGATGLGSLLTSTVQSAPAPVMQALGKMVLAHAATAPPAATATGTSLVGSGAKAVVTVTAILLVGTGFLALVPRRAPAPVVTNPAPTAVTFGFSTSVVWTAGASGRGGRFVTSTNFAITNPGPAMLRGARMPQSPR
jgi:RNA polymerase sigma factor (sigma-70 family)